MMPGPYNNTYMIFQTPDYLAIEVEMIHDTRIIPLGDRPHFPSRVRQYLGDSRGHWEGDTLVIETTTISTTDGDPGTQGRDVIGLRAGNGRTDDTMRVIERFTPVDADTFEYGSRSKTARDGPGTSPGRSPSSGSTVISTSTPVTRETTACRRCWPASVFWNVRHHGEVCPLVA